ncbi:MAG TPA: cytochrome C oxidase subunit IV family protein [Pirellulales bacterium]|jgi:cytochrome c oxidase subunit 4|nr:cytochrome C oxidase subunit IV family protein [Pirellulales bacterium]
MTQAHHARHPSVGALIAVFFALMALLAATVAVSEIDLGGPWNFAAAAAIATFKASLIIWFFMNLRYSTPLSRLTAFAALFWLAIMFVLTFADYLTRGWLEVTATW